MLNALMTLAGFVVKIMFATIVGIATVLFVVPAALMVVF